MKELMKNMTQFQRCSIFAAALIAIFGCIAAPLHAFTRGAVLSPTRVVIADRERSATVKIINPDNETNRYKISLVNMRMDEYGRRQEVETPTDEEAAILDMIRFSPRRATLKPKEWQTVRIMVRKTGDLASGEYRAHLKVVPIAPDRAVPEKEEGPSDKMSINFNLLFAITIPVIIRNGETSVELVPEKPVLVHPGGRSAALEIRLNRTGNCSAFFDIRAYASLTGGKRRKVGELNGVSMYTPNRMITLNIPLDSDQDSLLPGGRVELEIKNRENPKAPDFGSWQFVLE